MTDLRWSKLDTAAVSSRPASAEARNFGRASSG
jgi:hypothetical protein